MGRNTFGRSWLPLLLAIISLPAIAADLPADPASAVGRAGKAILAAVGGRTYAAAFAKTLSPSNPFGIDLEAVANAAGAKSVSGGTMGAVAGEGQLSILPQFNTPEQKFAAADATPAIIPFAFMVGGVCQGGYASGNPAAEAVFVADMAGRECSAVAVEKAVGEQYPLIVPRTALAETVSRAAASTATDALASDAPANGAPAIAVPTIDPAPVESDVEKVGEVILGVVNGRTAQQAIDDGGSTANPFGLEADPLLMAAGVYFLNTDATGAPIDTSEFSIYPDYTTPGDKFESTEATPPVLPFAFNRGGTCHGGYVTGYPVPDKVRTVDMAGKVCNAKTIDEMLVGEYLLVANVKPGGKAADPSPDATGATVDNGDAKADTSPAPAGSGVFDGVGASDHDLEMIVYGAYTAAYGQAVKHQNLFTSDDFSFADLRRAIRDTLDKAGYGAANVETAPVASAGAAKACSADGKVGLRLAFNNGGSGIVVAAVSDKRMSAYEYDPSQSSELVITHAADCLADSNSAADDGSDRLTTPAH